MTGDDATREALLGFHTLCCHGPKLYTRGVSARELIAPPPPRHDVRWGRE